MDTKQPAQLRLIRSILETLRVSGIEAWLFGGWGLDAQIGEVTRDHGDIEFWVERVDAAASRAALVSAGATVLDTQPPDEAREFVWDGVRFSTAYFDRRPDGSFTVAQAGGRTGSVFPTGSFADGVGTLEDFPVPTMSLAGMVAMKEQYPHLRNGRPWRAKDMVDIQKLRDLLASG